MPKPRVTIGMPVYNGEKWLRPTIESILAQSVEDLEIVISDNASTDGTRSVCLEYARSDSRLTYSRNATNIGIANNFNRVFQLAKGTYFKWMSCGDLIDRAFVSRCMELLDARPEVALVYSTTRLFVDDPTSGENSRDAFDLDIPDPPERFRRYIDSVQLNNIMQGLFRTDALRSTSLYRSFVGADYNMIAELLLYGRAVRIDETLFFRRMHPETATKFLSATEVRALYAPNQPSRLSHREWSCVLDYFRISFTAPLRPMQRARLLTMIGRRALWKRKALARELFDRLGHRKEADAT